jgi:sortase A
MTITIHWRPDRPGDGLLPWSEWVLLWIAFLSLGFCAVVYIDARLAQQYASRVFDVPARTRTPPPLLRTFAQEGTPLSRVEIPRLGISTMVLEGTTRRTLARSAGHIPGTAFPDETGNIGIAAHRDTFFRKLAGIRRDDVIRLTALSGPVDYIVEWTRVVKPTEVSVLAPTSNATLTLVSCYPFYYLGSAPQRFIVRARRSQASGVTSLPE